VLCWPWSLNRERIVHLFSQINLVILLYSVLQVFPSQIYRWKLFILINCLTIVNIWLFFCWRAKTLFLACTCLPYGCCSSISMQICHVGMGKKMFIKLILFAGITIKLVWKKLIHTC
jgi:hypothetical protein